MLAHAALCKLQALAEELARRLGRDRCWRVRWPSAQHQQQPDEAEEEEGTSAPQADSTARKDANEVLMKDGAQALADIIAGAEPYPIRGLFRSECASAV